MSAPIKLSDYFVQMGDAIANSGADRDLTDEELHDLHNKAEQMNEREAESAEFFLQDQGSVMDGWTLPIGPCIVAAWRWVRGWF